MTPGAAPPPSTRQDPWLGAPRPDGAHVVEAVLPAQRAQCLQVRFEVFVREQNVPLVLEVDARDFRPDVRHLLALDSTGRALGTLRLIPDGGSHFHLGRLAVRARARGRGIGALLVRSAHDLLAPTPAAGPGPRAGGRPRGGANEVDEGGEAPLVVLDAQVQAEGFYRALGYAPTTGEVFLDAGIEHVTMSRRLGARARH